MSGLPRRARLVTHVASGVVEIPLTGEPAHDALLERLAAFGGPTFRHEGEVDPETAAERAGIQDEAT
jgi:hypothetical protein